MVTPTREEKELRFALGEHRGALRFYLVLNLGFALVATVVLKLDGPVFADGIAAGLYLCGFATCLQGIRATRATAADVHSAAATIEAAPTVRTASIAPVLILLAAFHLAAAGATVWLTFISPVETPQQEGTFTTCLLEEAAGESDPASAARALPWSREFKPGHFFDCNRRRCRGFRGANIKPA